LAPLILHPIIQLWVIAWNGDMLYLIVT